MTAGTLSLRGLARLMGVSEKAVRKALIAGVFSDQAIHRGIDGAPVVLNATLAVDEWGRSGRQLRGDRRPTLPGPLLPPVAAAATLDAGVGQFPASGDDPKAHIAALLAQVRALRQAQSALSADASGSEFEADAEPSAGTAPTLVAAQTEAVLERGRKLRLENNLREGMLVEADQAAREAFEFARVIREAVLNIPARISAELAAETDGARVYSRLDAALRAALESTAATLEAAATAALVGEG